MSGVQFEDGKRTKGLMLGLSETRYQLAMANSVCWHGHVLRREDGHIFQKILDFEVKSQRRKRS